MSETKNSIPRLISLIYRTGHMYIARQLKHHGIGRGQYIFLNALYKKDGISQESLSNYLKIDKGTTCKAIKKLEEEGYILRQIDENDKRSHIILLTDKALSIKDEVRTVLSSWKNILSSGLTMEEKDLALKLLEKMGENAYKYVDTDTDI